MALLWESLKSARDLGRLHDVASVLIRYGFGDVVRRLGLSRVLERTGRALHWKDAEALAYMDPPERVRHALQELGPCYIKLGQLLATRVDLFPPRWISEFEKLQDQAPPVAFDEICRQLEEDLGRPVEKVFPGIEREPIAAASIAQVHRATLEDGTRVILKVRRPEVQEHVGADMRLIARLADIAEKQLAEAKRYRLTEIVRQFILSMRRELDFTSEGRHAERIAINFTDNPNVVIPKVYWRWTSERLIVQDYIDGIRGQDLAAIEAAGLDRKVLAKRGAEAVLQMILIDGFFHADPHLGNFFCLPDNRLGLIDFGMVGHLAEPRREQVVDLLYAMVIKDTRAVMAVLMDWAGDVVVNEDALAIEVDAFLDHYHGLPLKRLDLSAVLSDMVALLRDYQLALPPDLALLFKAFFTLDGVGRRLDPDFDMVTVAQPFLQQVMVERYMPAAVASRGWRQAREMMDVLQGLPGDMRRILKVARRGALQINVDMSRLDHFGHQLDRAASRLTVGLVTAAIIVGTSIVVTAGGEDGPSVMGMPLFGFIGFVLACLGGIWLLISIWRSRRG